MKEETTKPRIGRPPGKARPNKVFSYLANEELELLERLEGKLRRSRADVLREGLLELARKEGLEVG